MDTEALKQHVANVVKHRRKLLGLSQAALGSKVDLSETTISRIERAEYLPTLENMYGLSKALGLHPIELLQGDSVSKFLEGLPRDLQVELHGALGAVLSKNKGRPKSS